MIERRTRLNLEQLETRDVPSAAVQQALAPPTGGGDRPTETISFNFSRPTETISLNFARPTETISLNFTKISV